MLKFYVLVNGKTVILLKVSSTAIVCLCVCFIIYVLVNGKTVILLKVCCSVIVLVMHLFM